MIGKEYSFQQKIQELREREKELKCLYRIEEAINMGLEPEPFFYEVIKRIPNGWQFPGICKVKITFENKVYREPGWNETDWKHGAEIVIDDLVAGKIEVFYTKLKQMYTTSPFLPEEHKLLITIANRISNYIFDKRLENTLNLLQDEINETKKAPGELLSTSHDSHWQWRKNMAEKLTDRMNFDRFGVNGVYLIGSAKTAEAGPASDIDLIIHIRADKVNSELVAWIEGWSLCLSELNYWRTGYKTDGLIDAHFLTDNDIENKTSFAVMIGSVDNRAQPIKVNPK